ncbi:MAG: hypothetical protein R2722_17345 [Tessaracoccus sp.]
MVATLITHDFLRTRGLLFGAAGIALALGAFLFGTSWLLGGVLGQLTWVLGMVLAFGFLPLAQLWLAVDLYISSFSKRGYFVQTLPMSGSAILTAKYLWGLLVTVFAGVVSLILGTFTAATAAQFMGAGLREVWAALLEMLRMMNLSPSIWTLVIGLFVLYLVQSIITYYFCVTLGSEAWINKLGGAGPILVWVGFYVVMQIVALISLLLPGTLVFTGTGFAWSWDSFFSPLFAGMEMDPDTAGFPVMTILVIVLMLAVLVWRSYVSVSRKIDLR